MSTSITRQSYPSLDAHTACLYNEHMKSLHLSAPHLIAMVGMPGAGKTQFSEKFSETFGASRISIDSFLKLTPDRKLAHESSMEILQEFLKTKQTLVFDGDTEKRITRMELARAARMAGYKIMFVWVQTDLATAKLRWEKSHRGDDGEFEQLMNRFSAPHPSEPYIVISGRHTYSTQAKTVLRTLSEPRAASASVTPPAPRSTPRRSTSSSRITIN